MTMTVLSFGGGIQSTALLLMAMRGDAPAPDHVIFADPGWESQATMDHVAWCEKACAQAGISFLRVTGGDIRSDSLVPGAPLHIPFFIRTEAGKGQLTRQCTNNYKIKPIHRALRELLGYKPRQRIPPASCELQIGISTDEARRASPSRHAWIDHIYPLIDPCKMRRSDCQAWLETHYPDITVSKSACVGCPYHTDKDWLNIKMTSPHEWASIVAYDHAVRARSKGLAEDCYLHRSLVPIDKAPLGETQESIDFEKAIYCAGGCGL